jgi:hypothetical protein
VSRDEQTMTKCRLLAEEDPKHTTVPTIPQRFQQVHVIVSAMFDQTVGLKRFHA